jgi:hypothetical protein
MGRGSGTQNHCGNVTYRKLVYLNKVRIRQLSSDINSSLSHHFLLCAAQELYVTSSKHEKLKISKAIVAAVRHFGGRFIEVDETRGNAYFEIGDERSWKKTSQALREGQAEVRAQLAAEDAAGSKKNEYQQVISEQRFFAYACKILESLYNGDSGIAACGPDCPHAKRRQTLNQLGAHPMQIYYAMQSLSPHVPLPPPQDVMSQQQLAQDINLQYNQCYPSLNTFDGTSYFTSSSVATHQDTGDLYEPLPFATAVAVKDLAPLPYIPNRVDANMMHGSYEKSVPQFHPDNTVPATVNTSNMNENSADPYSTQTSASGLQRPGHLSHPETSMGSVFSLRKICSDDIEMSAEEGKVLMEMLDQEVEEIIRRKSYGLIKIDTTHAFEDLVFNDDIDDIPLKNLKAIDPADDKVRKYSSSTTNRSSSSRISGLSLKDDLSLMNMSVLSLDDPPKEEFAIQGEYSLKSSMKSDVSAPTENVKRDSRVSFNVANVSLMSMDNSSFSQLVSSLTDQETNVNKERIERIGEGSFDSPTHAISRKMGFPMRRTFIQKIGVGGLADESGQTVPDGRSSLTMSDASVFRSVAEFSNNSEDPMGVSSIQTLDSTQINSLLNDIDGEGQG